MMCATHHATHPQTGEFTSHCGCLVSGAHARIYNKQPQWDLFCFSLIFHISMYQILQWVSFVTYLNSICIVCSCYLHVLTKFNYDHSLKNNKTNVVPLFHNKLKRFPTVYSEVISCSDSYKYVLHAFMHVDTKTISPPQANLRTGYRFCYPG